MVGLKIEPKLRGGAEGLGEKPGSFSSNASLSANEFVDALNGDTEMGGEGDLGEAEGFEVFFEQNEARMGWDAGAREHGEPWYVSMVVDDRAAAWSCSQQPAPVCFEGGLGAGRYLKLAIDVFDELGDGVLGDPEQVRDLAPL